jgi:hypothetical protein
MLGEIKTPTIAELFVGDLAAIGNWVVANVRSSVAWPLQVEAVDFRGHRIFLVPRSTATVVADGSTVTMYPFAAVKLPAGTAFKDGCRLLSHFLSSLSWVEGGGITVEHWSGGSQAHPMGVSRAGGLVTSQFELDYLPDPTDQRVRWALAFYREGLSLERHNVAYATLSFLKILNIVANTGPKQKAWINSNFMNFGSNNHTKFEVAQRLTELKNSGVTDIGEYLYASCRCAVAHAGTNPTVDPENFDDMERLSKDLPLTRAMATHVIERELNVKSRVPNLGPELEPHSRYSGRQQTDRGIAAVTAPRRGTPTQDFRGGAKPIALFSLQKQQKQLVLRVIHTIHQAMTHHRSYQIRYTGESRCPRQKWIPAPCSLPGAGFAGKARRGRRAASTE